MPQKVRFYSRVLKLFTTFSVIILTAIAGCDRGAPIPVAVFCSNPNKGVQIYIDTESGLYWFSDVSAHIQVKANENHYSVLSPLFNFSVPIDIGETPFFEWTVDNQHYSFEKLTGGFKLSTYGVQSSLSPSSDYVYMFDDSGSMHGFSILFDDGAIERYSICKGDFTINHIAALSK